MYDSMYRRIDNTIYDSMIDTSMVYRCMDDVYNEHKDINYMDILDIYHIISHNDISYNRMYPILFTYYKLYNHHIDIDDIDRYMKGLHKVCTLDKDITYEFISDIKYRLKRELKKSNISRGRIESIRDSVMKIDNVTIRSTFMNIINKT